MSGVTIPREPHAGEEPSAGWARELTRAVRALRLSVAAPLALTQTPEGATLRLLPRSDPRAAAPERPFDVTFAGAVATFANCVYGRQSCTIKAEDIAYTVTGADGTIYLAVWIDAAAGPETVPEIHEGATLLAVTDRTVQEASSVVKIPLYQIRKLTDGATVYCAVRADYRALPRLGAWL